MNLERINFTHLLKRCSFVGLFLLSFVPSRFSYANPPRNNTSDYWADRILGQFDFSEIKFNEANAQNLFHPSSVFVDAAHDVLYVFDSGNNRILGVHQLSAASEGQGSDMVLGQPDFISTGSNHDSNWQTFSWQNSLLGIPQVPVFPSQNSISGIGYVLQSPAEATVGGNMAADSQGNLYVTDFNNNRVLRYEHDSIGQGSTGVLASHVWGQMNTSASGFVEDFTTGFPNDFNGAILGSPTAGGTPSEHSLNFTNIPIGAVAGVGIDPWGNLWVADEANNRVLRFPNPDPQTPGTVPSRIADVVLGQVDFFSRTDATGGTDKKHLDFPTGVRVDVRGNVYVSDGGNHSRIVIYKPSGYSTSGAPQYTQGSLQSADYVTTLGISSSKPLTKTYGVEFDPQITSTNSATNPFEVGLWVTGAVDNGNATPFFVLEYKFKWTGTSLLASNITVIKNVGFQASGAPGVDSTGNIYLASANGEVVTQYPYNNWPNPGVNVFKPPVGSGNPPSPNKITAVGLLQGNSVCVASAPGSATTQVIAADGVRIHYWNMTSGPSGLINGSAETGYAGTTMPYDATGNNFAFLATWNDTATNNGYLFGLKFTVPATLEVYKLPLSGSPAPLWTTIPSTLPVLGFPGQTVSWRSPQGLTVDLAGNVWVADTQKNRLLRIRNPLGVFPASTPVVDMILGQPNATTTNCNGSGTNTVKNGSIQPCTDTTPTASSLNAPGALAVDHHGDLYVADHSLESAGNLRMLRWNANTLLLNTSPTLCRFGVAADGVFGVQPTTIPSNEFTEYRDKTVIGDSGYWQMAFNSDDSIMVAGTDSQTSGGLPPVIIQNPRGVDAFGAPIPNNPLAGDNVIGHLNDFGPQSFGVAFDTDNNLYVSELNRSRVLVYLQPFASSTITVTPTATPTPGCFQAQGMIPTPTGGFGQLGGVATDLRNNRLYVADETKNLVHVYDDPLNGMPTFLMSISGVTNPDAVAVDDQGNIFVAQRNGGIQKFKSDGTPLVTIPTTFGIARIHVDKNGVLYIASTYQNNVYVYLQSCSGDYFSVAKFKGSGTVQLNGPGSLWKVGNKLYIADSNNNRIVAATETVSAGPTYTYTFAVVNLASSDSQLIGPTGITADLAGNFYVSSNSNCALLGFDSSFVFNRFLQTGLACYPADVAVDASGNIFESGSNGAVAEVRNCVTEPAVPPVVPTPTCLNPTDTPTITPTPDLNCINGYKNSWFAQIATNVSRVYYSAVDNSQNVFVLDQISKQILEFGPTPLAAPLKQWTIPLANYSNGGTRLVVTGSAIAVDQHGHVYVPIKIYSGNGNTLIASKILIFETSSASPSVVAVIDLPNISAQITALAINPVNDNLYVLASGPGGSLQPVVWVYSDSSFTPVPTNTPPVLVTTYPVGSLVLNNGGIGKGLAVDATGAFYVSMNSLYKFNADGTYNTDLETIGSNWGILNTTTPNFSFEPGAVSVDQATGNIYVADQHCCGTNTTFSRIDVFDPSGNIQTTFGSLGTGPNNWLKSPPVPITAISADFGCILVDTTAPSGQPGSVIAGVERWCPCNFTPVPTATPSSPTNTPTITPTYTATPSSPTNTPTISPTFTNTPNSPTNTPTITPTYTDTPTSPTNTPTISPTPTLACDSCSAVATIALSGQPRGLVIDNSVVQLGGNVMFVAGSEYNGIGIADNTIQAFSTTGSPISSSPAKTGAIFTDVAFDNEGSTTYVFALDYNTGNIYGYTYFNTGTIGFSSASPVIVGNAGAQGSGIWFEKNGGSSGANALYVTNALGEVRRLDGSLLNYSASPSVVVNNSFGVNQLYGLMINQSTIYVASAGDIQAIPIFVSGGNITYAASPTLVATVGGQTTFVRFDGTKYFVSSTSNFVSTYSPGLLSTSLWSFSSQCQFDVTPYGIGFSQGKTYVARNTGGFNSSSVNVSTNCDVTPTPTPMPACSDCNLVGKIAVTGQPMGLAIDNSVVEPGGGKLLFVAGSEYNGGTIADNTIQAFSTTGAFLSSSPLQAGDILNDVVFDDEGSTIYVYAIATNTGNVYGYTFDPSTNAWTGPTFLFNAQAGGSGIWFEKNGSDGGTTNALYVTNALGSILRFDGSGLSFPTSPSGSVPSSFGVNQLAGLTINNSTIYVAAGGTIQGISVTPGATITYGSPNTVVTIGGFLRYVRFDGVNYFIADSANFVSKYQPLSTFSWGYISQCQFDVQPLGIGFSQGKTYVSRFIGATFGSSVLVFSNCDSIITGGPLANARKVRSFFSFGSGDDSKTPTMTPTPTATPTPTQTPTGTPTATPLTSLVGSVFAGPNVSHGEPVNIHFTLGENAQVTLVIYTTLGEKVYSTSVQSSQGVNNLIWEVNNQAKSAVSSGLYVYVLQVKGDSGQTTTKTGKIAILH